MSSEDILQLRRMVTTLQSQVAMLASRVQQTWVYQGGGVANGSQSLVLEVIQVAHGFAIGDAVTNSGASWVKAVAGDDNIGVVCKVVDADTAWVCVWGVVCLEGATLSENETYYLTASAGVLSTTPGTPKRAVMFAASPTMVLVTNPSKDAAGGGLDAITGQAVLGVATATSAVPSAIAAGTNDTVLGQRGGTLTFAKIGTNELDDDAVTAAKLAHTAVAPGTYGGASSIPSFTVDAQGRITGASDNAASFTLAGDVSGAIGTNTVDKLKGKSLDAAVGTVSGTSSPDLFLWWDKTTQTWAPIGLWNVAAVTGWINCYDSAATDTQAKITGVMAGTKRSVFCRAEATDGLPASLEATTVNTVLGYRGTTLTWAKVSRDEQVDGAGCSVIGRSASTTGAVADITASSDNFVLGRRANVLTFAKVSRDEQADGAGCSVIGRSAGTTGAVADITAGADDTVLTRLSGTLSFAGVSRNALANGGACTVIGRSANSTGVVADISAGSNDTVLGRRSNTLTFAKVARAEMADGSAVSLIGRSANSTGAVADITGAANQVLACNGTPALAFSRTITLGDTSNAGSITIGNATSASAIVISPSLVTAAGRVMSVREIDVCDAGVAKKMLVLASAPY